MLLFSVIELNVNSSSRTVESKNFIFSSTYILDLLTTPEKIAYCPLSLHFCSYYEYICWCHED